MLKNILKLEGTQQIQKNDQKAITGGRAPLCCVTWDPVKRICSSWDYNCLGQ